MKKVIGIAGSLRSGSYNKSLIKAFANQAPEGVEFSIVEIDNLPFFNEDVEKAGLPEVVENFKVSIETADAVIVSTPEYNRSIPGVLKNALDWASRPYGRNSFNNKKVLVVGASNGSISTAVAQYDLKKLMVNFNTRIIGQPEFMLGMAGSKFDESGNLIDEETKNFIDQIWPIVVAD